MRQFFLPLVLVGVLSLPTLPAEVFPESPSPPSSHSKVSLSNASKPIISQDVYYKTKSSVSGLPAPRLSQASYPSGFGESRLIVWVIAQQHLYWGGFVIGSLFLVMILEVIGLFRCGTGVGNRYDALAQEILRLLLLALSITAILGGLFLISLLTLYPDLTSYLVAVFRSSFLFYGVLVLVFTLLTYLYYFSWEEMGVGWTKWAHASLGVLVNGVGITLTFISNAWSSFMMSPAGVDGRGRLLGEGWHTLQTALWNPFNVHRLVSHILLGAGVVAVYGAYRAMTAKNPEERPHYDWMAYVAFMCIVFAFFTMPFGGYWLMREIYAYKQQMGITLLGGLLAWLGVILVTLIGLFFFGLNYYLWQRIDAAGGTARYGRYSKYVFGIIALSMMVHVTPHTIVMTPLELKLLGGQQHPVLGNYGVESAKMTAMNMMMVMTLWSLVLWWRCRVPDKDAWSQKLNWLLIAGFLAGAVNILWLGVYGYYIPANVRIGLSLPAVVTAVALIILSVVVALRPLRHSQGQPSVWGSLSTRGYATLIGLGFLITWIMGLGGYRRSSVRLYWHINDIMRDHSPWAFTHTIGFAANVISLNALLFWAGLFLIGWCVVVAERREIKTNPTKA